MCLVFGICVCWYLVFRALTLFTPSNVISLSALVIQLYCTEPLPARNASTVNFLLHRIKIGHCLDHQLSFSPKNGTGDEDGLQRHERGDGGDYWREEKSGDR